MPQANARATNYKYTANIRNPPAQNVAQMVPQATAVQAVHVKGKIFLIPNG